MTDRDEIKPQDHPDYVGGWVWTGLEMRWIKQRIDEAVAAEREACAKVCEDMGIEGYGTLAIAASIRARGQA